MMHDLTDLLPPERARGLRQVYFLRLGVVTMVILAMVGVVHAVLLVPSYLFVREQVKERTQTLAVLTNSLAGTEEQEVSARVTKLREDSTYLTRLETVPKASEAIAAITSVPRSGVRLSGFSFEPSETGAQMMLSGVASTRESLRLYEQALRAQPYITSTDLPISAYAQERDIDFTIALTGSFLP